MPELHAVLSPSAAERWIQCPASVRMAAQVPPPPETPYAREGTLAHSLAELKARKMFQGTGVGRYLQQLKVLEETIKEEFGHDALKDMHRYVDLYVELLKEAYAERPYSVIMFEQRLDTGVPSSWGTTDCVIVSPTHVHVIDFKYGQGVSVSAVDNPQIKLYALGALDNYGDLLGTPEIVNMTIFQPRIGNTSRWWLTPEQLRTWRTETVIPAAKEALGENAHFGPSPDACRWCPIAGECRARMEKVTAEDFAADPDLLSPEEIGDVLARLPEIRAWCDAVANFALDAAYSKGVPIPGWKVVMSGGRRGISDHAAAIQTLIDAGYTAEQVARFSSKPLGELEKLVGKDELPELLGDLLVKSPGSPSLVKESDRRAAIQPNTEAAKDFGKDLL